MSVRSFNFLIFTLVFLGILGALTSDQFVWVGIVGALTLVTFFLYPKFGTAFTFVVILVSETLQPATGITAADYLDDVLIFACLASFTARRLSTLGNIRWMPALTFFVLYFALGLASSIAHDVPFLTSLLSGFLFVKGPLLAFAVAQIDWHEDILPKVAKFGGWLVAILLTTTLANAIAPNAWIALLGTTQGDERVGRTSLTSIFDHPVGLGTSMSLSFIAIYLYRKFVHRSILSLALLVGAALANIFSFRRKSIVSMLTGVVFGRLAMPGGRSLVVAFLVVGLPLATILAWSPLSRVMTYTIGEYFTDPDGTARILMTKDSTAIAMENFPLGAGLSRYGSHLARQDYSPEYSERGYQFIYGMGPAEDGMFLTDTFWPAVVGETGFFGLLCYLTGTLLLALPAWNLMRRSSEAHVCWIGAVGVAWLVALLVESVVAPVFSSPPMYGFFPVVAGICIALAQGHNERSAGAGGASQKSNVTSRSLE